MCGGTKEAGPQLWAPKEEASYTHTYVCTDIFTSSEGLLTDRT